MLLFILPGLLLTWALLSAFDLTGSDDEPDEEPNEKVTTDLTDGPDVFLGSAADDAVNALEGDDDVDGGEGDDLLMLGAGNDTGLGGPGDDELQGEDGDDFLIGGPGDDRVFGGAGNDYTYLSSDTLGGEANDEGGNDLLRGGAGDDELFDGLGQNAVYGDLGSDIVDGRDLEDSGLPDFLFGGFGSDLVLGDNGDTMTGGAGRDTFGILPYDGDEAVQITDFDQAAGEVLVIQIQAAAPGVLTLFETSGDTEVRVDGVVIAVLQGATGLDPASIQLVTDS